MDLNHLKDAIKGRVKPIGSWAWNRLNLARDAQAVGAYDFGPSQVREVKELMTKYAISKPEIRTINWLVPHVKHPLFAGVYTILRFADYFSREKGIQNRMIFHGGQNGTLAPLRKKIGERFPSLVDSIYGLGDGDPGKLPASDISFATDWTSAYLLLHAKNTAGKFYFVQDFEPLFYPAGATYGLVEATYRMGYWGIANTNGLGAHLRDSYDMTVKSFQPAVDPKMFYPAADRPLGPVKIFFYGRPRNPRNGFVLGIEALKLIKKQFKQDVQIVSAGGAWSPSDYGAKDVVENLGLLPTIEDVASLYRSCHIGLVFMFTKHPSYQPIEMMASGVAVVANENSALKLLLRNTENSLVVEPTVTSVAEAISCLVRDADRRNALASEGLKTAEQTHWNTEIEGVYEFLAGQRKAESGIVCQAPRTALRAESVPSMHDPFPNTGGVRPPGIVNSQDVLAVVVSCNGLQKTKQTVEALRRQVGHIHIVDNGSDAESLGVLESLEREPDITVERLGENRGVGYALNRGVQRARQMGCAWLLTMDQDSVVDGSLIEAYRIAVDENPGRMSLAPRITTRSRRKDAAGGAISYAITSGNLVRVSLFDQIGFYDEGFFIDCIDFDFCLRLRRAGYAVHRVPGALMQHQLGDSVDLPKAFREYYALHSPVRRYYMYRNFMYMAERYLFKFPGFIFKLGLSQMLLLLLIGFLDPGPLASYRAIARGMWDYALRKDGPYVERAA